jgi:NADPH:quinone reductase-like Zn-dependent oxidoreductase
MKAFIYEKYGSPDVLELREVPEPEPKADEIKIKVAALSINPAELHLMRATIWMLRLQYGLTKPKKPILGADVAGTVVAIGKDVTTFKIGDKILGRTYENGLAEYSVVKASKAALVPENLDFETAAAIPLAAVTALVAHRKANIQANQNVLINGASGGIGTFSVQLAKYANARVTGVCSAKNEDLVLSLGASNIVDYNTDDFTKSSTKYDVIIDLIGNRSVREIRQALAPNGHCVVVGYSSFKNMLGFMTTGSLLSATSNKKTSVIDAVTTTKDLNYLADLVVKNKIKPVIEKVFPFEQTPDAFRHLSTKRTRGKLVVKL